MAYMRGDVYVWHDGDNVHLWAANGNDGWTEAVWACDEDGNRAPDRLNASGVGIPETVLDEQVMMRLAEMIEEQSVDDVVARALAKHGGNFGCAALTRYATQLQSCLQQIQVTKPTDA